MIRKANEMIHEVKMHVREGAGEVHFDYIITKEESYDHTNGLTLVTLKPGCSIGYHQHVGSEEIYYILKGVADYQEDGESYQLNSGDMSVCFDEHYHGIANSQDEDLVFVAQIIVK